MARRLRRLGRGCKRATGRPCAEPGEPPDGLPLLQQPLDDGRPALTLPACSTARCLQSVRTADRRCRGEMLPNALRRMRSSGPQNQPRLGGSGRTLGQRRSRPRYRAPPWRSALPGRKQSERGADDRLFPAPRRARLPPRGRRRGPFGGEIFKERSGSQCLLCVVVHQIADENVGIERDHSMAASAVALGWASDAIPWAPAPLAATDTGDAPPEASDLFAATPAAYLSHTPCAMPCSMSSSDTGGSSCFSAPNNRPMGRTGRSRTSSPRTT